MHQQSLDSFLLGLENPTSCRKQQQRQPPSFKLIKDGPYAVDAFSYGLIEGVQFYFLTHFHSDHYHGLAPTTFSRSKIICSTVTARLVQLHLRIPKSLLHPLELYEPFVLPDGKCIVTLYNANHCPGSVMIVFDFWGQDRRILHTGDFRYDSGDEMLQRLLKEEKFFCLYFDNTYFSREYAFPSQASTLRSLCSSIQEILLGRMCKNPLLLVGTYSVGKERVISCLAAHFNFRINVTPHKKATFDCYQDSTLSSFITKEDANIQVISMHELQPKVLEKYAQSNHTKYDIIIAIRPTGWTQTASNGPTFESFRPPNSSTTLKNYIVSLGVPYSEHSSYEELRGFLSTASFDWAVGTSQGNVCGKWLSRKKLLGVAKIGTD